MNILFLSVGRRCELLKLVKKSLNGDSRVIATDMSPLAPALYFADNHYIVPRINDPSYINVVLDICRKENIDVVTTLIDPEVIILSQNRPLFEAEGIEVLAPSVDTAAMCFDKYEMFKYLKMNGIRTAMTWGSFPEILKAIECEQESFPLFVKPRNGSGSVGARKIETIQSLKTAFENDPSLIVQRVMTGENCFDLDADIYVDFILKKPVSIFTKKKLSTVIGGANRTISFIDQKLFDFLDTVLSLFDFRGPIDVDLFFKDGDYYLSEINPRFGGGYLHAYASGLDFIKMIEKNISGYPNDVQIGCYKENMIMMMYDSFIIENGGIINRT